MTTFATMVSRVRDELNRGTDHDTRIKQSIVSAIKYYTEKRFFFTTKRATSATADGVEYVALPSDFIEVDSLILTEDDQNDILMERTPRWIEQHKLQVSYESRPECFAVQDNELRLWPTPDDTYSLLMTYHCELPEVSVSASDAATNAWMTTGEELIRLHAKVDMLENVLRGAESIQEAQMLRAREQQVLAALVRRSRRQEQTGRLIPWC